MRLADARLAASIMISCSLIESFTGAECVWMMNTSVPRTESPKRQWISPLANSLRLGSSSFTPRCRAMSSARGRLERPETSCRRFLVTSSIGVLDLSSALLACSTRPLSLVAPRARSIERAGAMSGGNVASGRQPRIRAHDRALAHLRVLTDGVLDDRVAPDETVDEVGVGA